MDQIILGFLMDSDLFSWCLWGWSIPINSGTAENYYFCYGIRSLPGKNASDECMVSAIGFDLPIYKCPNWTFIVDNSSIRQD